MFAHLRALAVEVDTTIAGSDLLIGDCQSAVKKTVKLLINLFGLFVGKNLPAFPCGWNILAQARTLLQGSILRG